MKVRLKAVGASIGYMSSLYSLGIVDNMPA